MCNNFEILGREDEPKKYLPEFYNCLQLKNVGKRGKGVKYICFDLFHERSLNKVFYHRCPLLNNFFLNGLDKVLAMTIIWSNAELSYKIFLTV